jgi:hypothetical protein
MVDYLEDFNGYLQVDNYAGYEKTATRLVCCWTYYTRPTFTEAEVK